MAGPVDGPSLDALPDGVCVADADGVVVAANTALGRLLGRDPSELVGLDLAVAMPLDDRAGHGWVDCLRPYDGLSGRTRLAERSWYTSSGTELLLTAALHRDVPRGPVRQVVVSVRDGRARAAHERERSDLVATVAHELRSPLTGVKGFTSTLLRKWERFSDEQRQFMLSTIDNDADRLSRLITELLDAARIDSGRLTLRPEPIDVAAAVQRVLDTVSAAGDLQLRVSVEGELPQTWIDPDRLAQVVTNLVENAARHGRGVQRVALLPTASGVALEVDDAGPGVPEATRTRVFTRFWKSGERGGSGLGLYIVKGIVDGHGGEVEILDRPGGGARLRATFPLNRPAVLDD